MTRKQFLYCRLAIIIILSFSVAFSVNLGNYYLPIIFMATATGAMYFCRKQFKPVKAMVDERDYHIAGKSARYTIFVYGWMGAVGTFVLMGLSDIYPELYPVSQYLAFSVCFLILFNAILFKYWSRKGEKYGK